jgi:perosamine synthetase
MNELTAAVALAQVERVEDLVSRRQKVASFFLDAIKECSWLVPQKVPQGFVNTYWTFTLIYYGDEKHSVSWQEFWSKYKEMGGDGFYGGLSVVYQEPVIANGTYLSKIQKDNQENTTYEGSCPNAEDIQPRMMQFKTNYRDLNVAKKQANILKKLIEYFSTS